MYTRFIEVIWWYLDKCFLSITLFLNTFSNAAIFWCRLWLEPNAQVEVTLTKTSKLAALLSSQRITINIPPYFHKLADYVGEKVKKWNPLINFILFIFFSPKNKKIVWGGAAKFSIWATLQNLNKWQTADFVVKTFYMGW